MADKYKVSPYAIINSEYNHLQNAVPSSLIPANALQIMIPGGTTNKVAVYWKPTINLKPASACSSNCGSENGKNGTIEFGGGPGSCGFQQNGGGDGNLRLPLSGYTVVRGFSSYHSGIDLAKPTGSPVYAAGTGTIIFAGWSDWGYGNSIVIAHTPGLMTLYGHLSQIDVSCGQFVKQGQLIGNVGSTGNSTGPHLHFEIRVNQVPVNPTGYLGF
jgi:murein DD-endopeptidase MepM/ murein hydrolase activator NlpD